MTVATACENRAGRGSPDGSADAPDDVAADTPRDARDEDSRPDGAAPDGGLDAPAPDSGSDGGTPDIDWTFDGGFVRKVFPLADGGAVVLLEPLLSLRIDFGLPRREVLWVAPDGSVTRRLAPPAGTQLLDAAVHPSEEVSVLLASDAGYRLSRLTAAGTTRGETDIEDPAIASDPPALAPGSPVSPIEPYTHDAGRVASVGEDIVLAARTGRHSVIVYRVGFDAGAFVFRYRTLAFPAGNIMPIGLNGGTYDTFGQVEAQYLVHLAVEPDGAVYVGVRYPELSPNRFAAAVEQAFGEDLPGDPDFLDSYVARLSADGTRLGTSVVTTEKPDEIYGLRAVAGAAYVLGRNEAWNTAGTGFDALVARVDGASGAVQVTELDVDRGDISFDVALLPDGELVLVGASGYAQNPNGASISEESALFARRISPTGSVREIALVSGPRHNEARFVSPWTSGRVLVAGMVDGPGTHSADGDPSALRARGFVRTVAIPP